MKFFPLIATLLCVWTSTADAFEVNEMQRLDFGQFYVKDNLQPHSIAITPDDEFIEDPSGAFIMGNTQPQRGVYELKDFPPNLTLQAGVNYATPPDQGGVYLDSPEAVRKGGRFFNLSDFKTNSPVTDSDGSATLYIGATLSTSGTGVNYDGGSYGGSIDITFYY